MMRYFAVLLALATAIPSAVAATDKATGSVANSAVGQAGQRQTRETGIEGQKPMARIESRIANRVQSRIRNRIDRDYDPQANAISPFKVADETSRRGAR